MKNERGESNSDVLFRCLSTEMGIRVSLGFELSYVTGMSRVDLCYWEDCEETTSTSIFHKMLPYLCKDISGIEGVTALANRNRYISVFPNPVQGYEHSNNDKQVGPQSQMVYIPLLFEIAKTSKHSYDSVSFTENMVSIQNQKVFLNNLTLK